MKTLSITSLNELNAVAKELLAFANGEKFFVFEGEVAADGTWSVETSGILDINGEVDLWTKVGHVKIQLRKGINVKEVDTLIARSVFNKH